MERLIAEGREIVKREGLQPKTAGLDPDLWAATVALGRYDAAHMEWVARGHPFAAWAASPQVGMMCTHARAKDIVGIFGGSTLEPVSDT
jgi:hypothetical protein